MTTQRISTGMIASGAPAPIVLASASRARADMLARAGVACETEPARIDEREIKRMLSAQGAGAAAQAAALAEHKAEEVSGRRPDALVVAADQILECRGAHFDKPRTRAEAADQLRALRGRPHRLVSAACAVKGGAMLWRQVDRAQLWMRPFSESFLEGYLDAVGEAALQGPGGYQVEGLGIQLLARVEGDHFTVLGMPLLSLLDFLRARGAIAA